MKKFEEKVKICLCLCHVCPSTHLDILYEEFAGLRSIRLKLIVAEVLGNLAGYFSRQIGRVKISRP